MSRCDRSPEGWYCSREKWHNGPCAARPTDERVIEVLKLMDAGSTLIDPDLAIIRYALYEILKTD